MGHLRHEVRNPQAAVDPVKGKGRGKRGGYVANDAALSVRAGAGKTGRNSEDKGSVDGNHGGSSVRQRHCLTTPLG
jgi:hypothetical protein